MRDINKTRRFKLKTVYIAMCLLFLSGGYSVVQASVQEKIAERQKQIEAIEQEIASLQQQIIETQGQARTLQSEINVLNVQIRQIELGIRSLELSINETSDEINVTGTNIQDAKVKLLKHKEALVQLIKLIDQNDNKSMTEILLSYNNLSDFFNALNDIKTNQETLQTTISEMKILKSNLESYQNLLEEKLTELDKTRQIEALERQRLSRNKTLTNRLFKETKGQEARFQELVLQSERSIEAIKAQIQYLVQSGITAEEAVRYAQLAAIATSIRPAFLLALLEYETGLGRNVGQCILKDSVTANGVNLRTGSVIQGVMKPMGLSGRKGDVDDFLLITRELGLDPFNTSVSCPQSGGYGGAMGPAQFIPTTWIGYREETARVTGHNPPNPWNIEDAFTASAIKLARGGATIQTRAAEIAAAKAYLSGNSRCSTSACNRYANGIQNIAAEIEKNL